MDLLLTDDDLTLVDGDLVLVSGAAAVRQRVLIRLRTQLGEWALDTRLGLDYLGEIFGPQPDVGLIRSRVLALVAGTPGVLQVRFVRVEQTGRKLTIEFIFLTEDDPTEEQSAGLEVDGSTGELNLLLGPIGGI